MLYCPREYLVSLSLRGTFLLMICGCDCCECFGFVFSDSNRVCRLVSIALLLLRAIMLLLSIIALPPMSVLGGYGNVIG